MKGKEIYKLGVLALAIITIFSITIHTTSAASPPTTTIKVGEPSFGILNEWVSVETPIWVNGSDADGDLKATYYKIYYNGYWHPLSPNDTYCGNYNITYYNDELWYIRYNETVDFAPIHFHEECEHKIEYFSIDEAGNEEEYHIKTFYVDDTPPHSWVEVGDPHYEENGIQYVTTNTEIIILANDYGQECVVGNCTIYYRYWKAGTPKPAWQQGTPGTNVTFKFDETCKHYLEWFAVDVLGNNETEAIGEVHNMTFEVDDTPPIVTKEYGEPSVYQGMKHHWDWMDWWVSEGSLNIKSYEEIKNCVDPPMYDDTGRGDYYVFMNNCEIADPDLSDTHNEPDIVGELSWIEGTEYHYLLLSDQEIGAEETVYTVAKIVLTDAAEYSFTIYAYNSSIQISPSSFVLYGPGEYWKLIEIENPTSSDITTDFEIRVQKSGVASHEGVYIAGSSDITYYFVDPSYWKEQGYIDWKVWLWGSHYIINPYIPIYINATDDKSGVYKIHYRICYNGEYSPWYESRGNVTFTLAELGYTGDCLHAIEYYAEDNLGNAEYHVQGVCVDNTPPIGETITGKPNYESIWVNSSTQIWLNASDTGECQTGVDNILYEIWWDSDGDGEVDELLEEKTINDNDPDDNDKREGYINVTIGFDEECMHLLVWMAYDKLGNMYYDSQFYYVDNTPPVTYKEEESYYNATEDIWYIKPCTTIQLLPVDLGDCAVGINVTYWGFVDASGNWWPDPSNDRVNYSDYTEDDVVYFATPKHGHNYWYKYDPERPIHWQEECEHTLYYFSVDYLGNIEGTIECENDSDEPGYFLKPGFRYGPDRQPGTNDDYTYAVNQYAGPNGIVGDQDDNQWGNSWCVPSASASCLEWFADWYNMPALKNKTIYQLADTLGDYMNTDPWAGTWWKDWIKGLRNYINDKGLGGRVDVTSYSRASFSFSKLKEELEECQDVMLAIYWNGNWHAVTVSSIGNARDTNAENTFGKSPLYKIDFMDPLKGDFVDTWIWDTTPPKIYYPDYNNWYEIGMVTICPRLYQKYKVDGTAPTTVKHVGEPKYKNGEWVTSSTPIWLNATDGGECPVGVKYIHYEIWLDGQLIENKTVYDGSEEDLDDDFGGISVLIYLQEESMHTIRWYAVDYLGNVEDMHEQTHYVDNSEPFIDIEFAGPICPLDGDAYGVNYSTITHILSDDTGLCTAGIKNVTYRIWFDGTWHPTSETDTYCGNENVTYYDGKYWFVAINDTVEFTNIKFHEECVHYLYIEAKDNLGNVITRNITYAVDDSKPISWITIGEPRWGGDEHTSHNISNMTVVQLHGMDGGCLNRWKIIYWIDDQDVPFEGGWYEVINLTFTPGNHTLYWYATDGVNDEDLHNHTFYVIAEDWDFEYSPSYITTSTIVFFYAHQHDNPVLNFTWDFGDGTYGYGGIITHVFAMPGLYNVTLTITAFGGDLERTVTKAILVYPSYPDPYPPVADFNWTPLEPSTNDVIQFNCLSYDTDPYEAGWIVSRVWIFGDGTIIGGNESSPTHQYADDGLYNVTLYVWDDEGAIATITKQINVSNVPPVANFSYWTADKTVYFNDESYDTDGSIVNWTWNFGDGNISYKQNVNYTYATNGVYNVSLTVKDDDGAIATIWKLIYVDVEWPVANFTIEPCCGIPGETIYFNSTSYDPDEYIENYTWDLGDYTYAYGDKVTHSYAYPGLYDVTLTVVDSDGLTANITKSIRIYDIINFTLKLYPGWNLITVPVQYYGNASDLAAYIEYYCGPETVLAIARWNATRDMFEMHLTYDPYLDFPIEEGVGYFIYLNYEIPVNITFYGYPILRVNVPVQARNLTGTNTTEGETNWNLLGWFKYEAGYETMNVTVWLPYIIEKITGNNDTTGTSVAIWDAINQTYLLYMPGIPPSMWQNLSYFDIETGMGVFVWLPPVPEGTYWQDSQCP